LISRGRIRSTTGSSFLGKRQPLTNSTGSPSPQLMSKASSILSTNLRISSLTLR
jgi:hypothetical protein